jgi:glycosyltransferase involved in cell wall biosynthesis
LHISFFTSESGYNPAVGYGQASMGIITSLQKLGHLVTPNNAKADLQLNFISPIAYKYNRPTQYTIGYTPWESTLLPHFWKENMNRCDEVWATCAFNAWVYREQGVTRPIKIYKHGLHDVWKNSTKRTVGSKFRFLHIGEPSERKGGSLTVKTFIETFGNNPDVELTVKCHETSTIRVYDMFGERVDFSKYPNIKFVSKEMSDEELVMLMHSHHCLIYPSYGEGFGFIPIQAMATGMPVICTEAWAPYKEFITLKLQSTLGDSPWPLMLPGKMFHPDVDHLKYLMTEVVYKYDQYVETALSNLDEMYKQYDWLTLTEKAFAHLKNIA